MKLYNTRTRKLEPFVPATENTVRMYSCGPTMYDHAHIGNLSAYIFADSLRRSLRLAGFQTQHAMNYTDVDDKTIRRSREQYPGHNAQAALRQLTDTYIKLFREDIERVGVDLEAIMFLRATDHIDDMQALIAKLHAHGFAYIADDGVYFSIEAYRKSGKTYGQLLDLTSANTSEARIQNDEYDKESVHDFALWKAQKPGEPAWGFTLDGQQLAGRPGWHIECSVMSRAALGQPFDIHTGGVDLIFPHHENEIAQSTALESDPVMAQVFAHNEHILVDGKKMSKSAGNFYVLEDVVKKGFDPLAFRLKVLQSHYRNSVNFTWESLEAAQHLLENLRMWADLKHQPHAAVKEAQASKLHETYAAALKQMLAATQNDLDTPRAIAALAQLATQSEGQGIALDKFQPMLNIVDQLFGLRLSKRPDITTAQKALIAGREDARADKDWARSDELRDALKAQNIGLRDTETGTIWFRI